MGNKNFLFCIGSQRSGTTALRYLFRKVQGVSVFDEIFDKRPDLPYFTAYTSHFNAPQEISDLFINPSENGSKQLSFLSKYFDYLRNLCDDTTELIYADIKYSFLYGILPLPEDSFSSGLIQWISTNREAVKVINIQRWNKLDQYISMLKSDSTRLWVIDNDGANNNNREEMSRVEADYNSRLVLDKDKLQYSIQKLVLLDEIASFTLTSALETSGLLQFNYEDLFLSDHNGLNPSHLSRIEEFLGLPDGSLPSVSQTKKLMQKPSYDIIANYQEVGNWLTEIGFERFLC